MERLRCKKRKGVTLRRYLSKENKLYVDFLQYTPFDLVKIDRLRQRISPKINDEYRKKLNRNRKKTTEDSYGLLLGRVLKRYFEWIILKCIEGNVVCFTNDCKLIFRVLPYYPTDVELKRNKDLKNYIRIKDNQNRDKLVGDIKDFKLRYFRIVLMKQMPDGYRYTNYFLRLNTKYKRMLAEQVKLNPKQYDFTI